jgi:hypothetical protein
VASNGLGRVRAGFLRARPVGCIIGAVWAASFIAAYAPAVALARAGPIAARRTFQAPLTHSDFKAIAAATGWAVKAAPADARTGRTAARRTRPTTVDELGQLGELAPAQHAVAIKIEPAEQRAEVAVAWAAHRSDRATCTSRATWTIGIAWTIRFTRAIRAAWTIRFTRAVSITWTIWIALRIAIALVAVARFAPAFWPRIAATFSIAIIVSWLRFAFRGGPTSPIAFVTRFGLLGQR